MLREVHCVEKGHIGTKKTAIEVILKWLLCITNLITYMLCFNLCRLESSMTVCPGLQLTSLWSCA